MQPFAPWPSNPMEVRPRFERDGYQGSTPDHEGRSAAAAAFCNGRAAARRRAPVAKLPSWHVPPVRPAPSVVRVVLPPRRRAWARGASATILPADGRTAPPAPAAPTRIVKRPGRLRLRWGRRAKLEGRAALGNPAVRALALAVLAEHLREIEAPTGTRRAAAARSTLPE